MSPHAPEVHTALRMLPLLERGREALLVYIRSRNIEERRRQVLLSTATTISVVTHADYVANAALCLRHVEHNGVSTHILNENGALCVVLAQRIEDW